MSVLIPFLICGACLIFRWRASMSTNQDFGGHGNSTSHNVYQRQQNNPMQHQITKSASFSDDEAVPKSSRLGTPQTKQRNPSSPHQGVYYTNEPLDMYTRNWPNKSTNYSTATCMSLIYFGFTTGCSVDWAEFGQSCQIKKPVKPLLPFCIRFRKMPLVWSYSLRKLTARGLKFM